VADLFYTRLFAIDPSLRPLFQTDMQAQKAKLMATLAFIVEHLMQLDALIPAVQALGQRHAGYGVAAKDYEPLGRALIGALEEGIGPAFTPEVKAAWLGVYTLLANTMIQATEESKTVASKQ